MNIFKRILGFSVLWPWSKYRFTSRKMHPRFNKNGDIYMLLCENPNGDQHNSIGEDE